MKHMQTGCGRNGAHGHAPAGWKPAREVEVLRRMKCMNWAMMNINMTLVIMVAALGLCAGCGGTKAQTQNRDFFTSGSREADQRASQRMAKDEQLTGSGEGAGEKGVKKAVVAKNS